MRPLDPEEVLELREIPPEGLHLELDLSGRFGVWAFEGTEVATATAVPTAVLDFQRTGPDVYLSGQLRGSLELPCGRCNTSARLEIDAPFQLVLAPVSDNAPSEEEGEVELEDQDLDYAVFSNDRIPIAEILREQLLLVLPIAHLCREDCAGLCPRCGQDLNVARCDCQPEPRDDRWAALRDVKV